MRIWLGFLLGLSLCLEAHAAESVVLREELSLYRTTRVTVSPRYRLRKGQAVQVQPKPRSGFYSVKAKVKGQPVQGYATVDSLKSYMLGENASPGRMAGFSYVFAQQSQKDRELQTSDETTYQISEFSGSSQFFRFFYDVKMSPTLLIRWSLVKRETESKGDASVVGSPTSSSIILTQSFLGVQGEMLYSTGQFWVGGGIEVSKGMSVDIETVSGPVLADSDLELPFFTILSGSAGAYFGPYGQFYLMPEVRAGFVVTTDPMTQLIEVLANVGYRF